MYPRAHIYFAMALLVALIGFYPSYFSRLTQADAAHHFHGITATGWMVMLIVQSWLMHQRQLHLHRALGKTSLVLVPLFVVSGLMVVHVLLSATHSFAIAFGPRLAFLDFTTLAYFVATYGLALHYRRNVQLHARLMASTVVLVLPPALSRLIANYVPVINSFEAAVHVSYWLTELVAAALILDDRRSGRIRAPYVSLLGILVVQQLGFLLLPSAAWWTRFSAWFGAL